MLRAVRDFRRSGGLIYAECGGLIYLSGAFQGPDAREYPLAGLIPGRVRMTERLQHFGYHEIESASDNFLFARGTRLRSHEFHYSVWDPEGAESPAFRIDGRPDGFASEGILASYQHLHFGAGRLADSVIEACRKKRFAMKA